MTVVCEFCDRSFTYNSKPESEEKKINNSNSTIAPTIKITTPHWLWDSLSHWERAHIHHGPYPFDRSVFVTSVNMCCRTLISNYRIASFTSYAFFLLIKKFFSFFCTYFLSLALSSPKIVLLHTFILFSFSHSLALFVCSFLSWSTVWFIFRSSFSRSRIVNIYFVAITHRQLARKFQNVVVHQFR